MREDRQVLLCIAEYFTYAEAENYWINFDTRAFREIATIRNDVCRWMRQYRVSQ